jgi:hypothetical protein
MKSAQYQARRNSLRAQPQSHLLCSRFSVLLIRSSVDDALIQANRETYRGSTKPGAPSSAQSHRA